MITPQERRVALYIPELLLHPMEAESNMEVGRQPVAFHFLQLKLEMCRRPMAPIIPLSQLVAIAPVKLDISLRAMGTRIIRPTIPEMLTVVIIDPQMTGAPAKNNGNMTSPQAENKASLATREAVESLAAAVSSMVTMVTATIHPAARIIPAKTNGQLQPTAMDSAATAALMLSETTVAIAAAEATTADTDLAASSRITSGEATTSHTSTCCDF
jgi:hypothetical protein